MKELILTLPDRVSRALKVSDETLEREILFAAAVKFYELGRLSSGAAAGLAGVPKPFFLAKLGDYGVCTFELKKEELQREMAILWN